MNDPHLADHAVGLELQIEELIERRQRAIVQGRPVDAAQLDQQIEALQDELAATAEQVAATGSDRPTIHDAVRADKPGRTST